jgi:hypothetical protein
MKFKAFEKMLSWDTDGIGVTRARFPGESEVIRLLPIYTKGKLEGVKACFWATINDREFTHAQVFPTAEAAKFWAVTELWGIRYNPDNIKSGKL